MAYHVLLDLLTDLWSASLTESQALPYAIVDILQLLCMSMSLD